MTDEVRTRPRDRRASILLAAGARFSRRGYAGTSLDDIAGDLGITAPALYRHFRSKEELYTATLEADLQHLERCVAEASTIEEVVAGLAGVAVEHPTLGLLWNTERRRRLVDPEGAIQRRLLAAADAVGAILERGPDAETAHLLARATLAAASSTGFYASPLAPDAQARQVERALAVVASYRPAEPLVALEVA